MTERNDRTTSGGYDAWFHSTHWTEIQEARSMDELQKAAALEGLLQGYWRPVYCYLRCKGCDKETAKDLTQGFFHEVVLGRGLIQQADRRKGKFRTFLLTALDRYAANVHQADVAKKRIPQGGLIRFEEIAWSNIPEPVHYATPAEVFDYTWASALLDHVIQDVEGECRGAGMATHWKVFRARVLTPILDGMEPPPLAELCVRFRTPKKAQLSNMIVTVKRRFQVILRRHVRQLVGSEAEVYEEIGYLMKVFAASAQDGGSFPVSISGGVRDPSSGKRRLEET